MSASSMRVFLDDQPCAFTGDNVAKAIAQAYKQAQANGRMIVEVNVDGQTWSAEQLDSPAHASVTASVVHLTTAHPKELARHTLADASHALEDIAALQQNAAELLQQDQIPAAMHQLQDAMAIWMSVQQALTMSAPLADIDLNRPAQGMDVSVNIMIQQLNEQLHAMREALTQQDTSALADTLLYDFPPVIRAWQTMLKGL